MKNTTLNKSIRQSGNECLNGLVPIGASILNEPFVLKEEQMGYAKGPKIRPPMTDWWDFENYQNQTEKRVQAGRIAENEILSLVALSLIDNLGPIRQKQLIGHFGNADLAIKHLKEGRKQGLNVSKKVVESAKAPDLLDRAYEILRQTEKSGCRLVAASNPSYPELLRESIDSPLLLYFKGESWPGATMPAISIVGTRSPSEYGMRCAKFFAAAFAEAGFNVVSGLALGIDAEAHKAALDAQGITTAILGHGLNYLYPNVNRPLAQSIVDQGGALITEFEPYKKPEAHHFPSRNRIIANMSLATLVVEAQEKGGALITARFAFEQNRLVYAIPGNIFQEKSTGCNQLIRDCIAKIAISPQEIIDDLIPILENPDRLLRREAHNSIPYDPEVSDCPILSILTDSGLTFEQISQKLDAEVDLAGRLLELELEGKVARTGCGYRRV